MDRRLWIDAIYEHHNDHVVSKMRECHGARRCGLDLAITSDFTALVKIKVSTTGEGGEHG